MVCATAILSSSLALSLLRHSAAPSQSFVLSPYSLNTALSIVHDGAAGDTQKELTDLLLKGCTPSDVTEFYSSLALSLSSINGSGVTFKSANRFYIDDSISLKNEYQNHVENKYKVKVENVEMSNTVESAKKMNDFVEAATNGKIKDIIDPQGLNNEKAILINAVHFLGNWKTSFSPNHTHERAFKSDNGEMKMKFMSAYLSVLRNSRRWSDSDKTSIGTALVLPYADEKYSFFYLMPAEDSTLDAMLNELTGEKLVNYLKAASPLRADIIVPKFKMESELNGVDVLTKLGVNSVFSDSADLSKISSTPLKVSNIAHKAVIEMHEQGTEAAAVTVIGAVPVCAGCGSPSIVVDRPFLFGILNGDNILFLGQFNG